MPDEAEETADPAAGSTGRNSTLVAAGILLSRVSGLARESAVAAFLGNGLAVDAFTAALRIPNTLQNLLGEGVLSASFIPVYSRLLAEGRREEAGRLAGAVAGLLALLTGVLAVAGVVFAGPITRVIAFGYSGERLELTVRLVRILTPGIGLLVLSAWCLGVLNSHRRFFLAYVAPVLWNVAQIAVLVTLGLTAYRGGGEAARSSLAVGLAWGTVAGGLLQFGVQVPSVLRLVPGLRLRAETRSAPVRRVLGAFGPVVGARGVVQLSAYFDIFLASFLVIGAPAALRYSQVLYLLPISLFGMSIAAAELPELSSAGPADRRALARRLDGGLARIAFFVLPTAVAYVVVGDLVVAALFQRGAFGPAATMQVWIVLAGYAVGLPASGASRLYQSALYGTGDARTPSRVAVVRVAVAAAVGVLLMLQLDRVGVTAGGLAQLGDLPALRPLPQAVRTAGADPPRLGALGLTLASGAAAWVELVLLRRAVTRRIGLTGLGGGFFGRIAVATAAAGGAALLLRPLTGGLPPLLAAPLVLTASGAVYLAAGSALRLPEALAVRRRLLGR